MRLTTRVKDKVYYSKGKYPPTTLCAEMETHEIRECMKKLAKYEDLQDAFNDGYKQVMQDGWIPVSERLPQLPDGKSFMPLNATILAPSGLRNTVQMTWELKRGKPTWCYLGGASNWNVIAWQSLPEPWKESVEE